MEGTRYQPRRRTRPRGPAMIAIHTVYPPRLAAQHQPHDQLAQPAAHAMRSPSERMPANISHLFLHYALRAYRRLAGAAVLASVLKSFATTFTLIVTRPPCPGPAERVR